MLSSFERGPIINTNEVAVFELCNLSQKLNPHRIRRGLKFGQLAGTLSVRFDCEGSQGHLSH